MFKTSTQTEIEASKTVDIAESVITNAFNAWWKGNTRKVENRSRDIQGGNDHVTIIEQSISCFSGSIDRWFLVFLSLWSSRLTVHHDIYTLLSLTNTFSTCPSIKHNIPHCSFLHHICVPEDTYSRSLPVRAHLRLEIRPRGLTYHPSIFFSGPQSLALRLPCLPHHHHP